MGPISPIRAPFYDLPPFPDLGDAELNKKLETWRLEAGKIYSRNLFELERLPAGFSTALVNEQVLTSVFTQYVGKDVGLLGNEQIFVLATVQMETSQGTQVSHTLRVTYPSGAQELLSSMTATLDPFSTNGFRQTVTGHWQVAPRIQQGGKHTFDIMVAKASAAGTTCSAEEAVLTIFAF